MTSFIPSIFKPKEKKSLLKDPRTYAAGGLAALGGLGLRPSVLRTIYGGSKVAPLFGAGIARQALAHGTTIRPNKYFYTLRRKLLKYVRVAETRLGRDHTVSRRLQSKDSPLFNFLTGSSSDPRAVQIDPTGYTRKTDFSGPADVGPKSSPRETSMWRERSDLNELLKGVTDLQGNSVVLPTDSLQGLMLDAIKRKTTVRKEIMRRYGTTDVMYKGHNAHAGSLERYRKPSKAVADILDRPITVDDISTAHRRTDISPIIEFEQTPLLKRFHRKLPGFRKFYASKAQEAGASTLPTNVEFRVHAVNGKVVPGATLPRWDPLTNTVPLVTKRTREMESQAQHILDQLVQKSQNNMSPDPRKQVMGLDLGIDSKGGTRLIEVNPSDDDIFSGYFMNPFVNRAIGAAAKGKTPMLQRLQQVGHSGGLAGLSVSGVNMYRNDKPNLTG